MNNLPRAQTALPFGPFHMRCCRRGWVAVCGDGGGHTHDLLVNNVSKVKEKEKKNIPRA